MTGTSQSTSGSPSRTAADVIVLGSIGLWGAAAVVLTVLAGPSAVVLTTGIAIGALTIVLAALGFWFRSTTAALLGASAVLSIGLVVNSPFVNEGGLLLTVGGVLGLVLTGCATAIIGQLRQGGRTSSTGDVSGQASAETGHHIEQLLAQIYENSMLSDSAKRVIFREREISMLREAIAHDIAKGDYGAALSLCDEIANLFGQRETAEKFRQEIEHARREHYEAEIQEAVRRLDEYLAKRDWAAAHQEAGRIRRLFPDAHVLHEIDHKIEGARREHKLDLESCFLKAAEHEDVEQAMTLLRELDRYLSPDEAAQFTEVAQGVVTKHRDNLGVQFKLAVNDKRWSEAAQIGGTIIAEFPNTKMADEVRSMIDLIRTRATQAAVSAQGG